MTGSFFNQFVTDIYIYIYTHNNNRVLIVKISGIGHRSRLRSTGDYADGLCTYIQKLLVEMEQRFSDDNEMLATMVLFHDERWPSFIRKVSEKFGFDEDRLVDGDTDSSLHGQFVTDSSLLDTSLHGHFVTGHFVTWTVRYMDSSLHGYFNMKSLWKQTIF